MNPRRDKAIPLDPLAVPRALHLAKCKHCDDTLKKDAYCDDCKRFLTDQCSQCHDEVAHDRIRVSNINTHGGRKKVDNSGGRARRPKTIESRRKGT